MTTWLERTTLKKNFGLVTVASPVILISSMEDDTCLIHESIFELWTIFLWPQVCYRQSNYVNVIIIAILNGNCTLRNSGLTTLSLKKSQISLLHSAMRIDIQGVQKNVLFRLWSLRAGFNKSRRPFYVNFKTRLLYDNLPNSINSRFCSTLFYINKQTHYFNTHWKIFLPVKYLFVLYYW